jgi:virulence-associated protein VapD
MAIGKRFKSRTTRAVFEDQKQLRAVPEVIVHMHNIRVIQIDQCANFVLKCSRSAFKLHGLTWHDFGNKIWSERRMRNQEYQGKSALANEFDEFVVTNTARQLSEFRDGTMQHVGFRRSHGSVYLSF